MLVTLPPALRGCGGWRRDYAGRFVWEGGVTAPARISQADMDRAVKAAAKVERARIILDLKKGRIEIIVGESGDLTPAKLNEWDDI